MACNTKETKVRYLQQHRKKIKFNSTKQIKRLMHKSDVCLLENSTWLCVLDVVAPSLSGNCALETMIYLGYIRWTFLYVAFPRYCATQMKIFAFRTSSYVRTFLTDCTTKNGHNRTR